MVTKPTNYLPGRNIEKFQGFLNQKLAADLVSRGAGLLVVSNLENWSGIDLSKFALQLIREKQGSVVVDNFHIFKSLGEQMVANALIAAGETDCFNLFQPQTYCAPDNLRNSFDNLRNSFGDNPV